MSNFTHWKVSQVSKTLKPCDNVRVPHERKKENKKHEELPGGPAPPHGQLLQKGEGDHIPEDRTEDAGGDQPTEEGPPVSKTEARKDAKGACGAPPPLPPAGPFPEPPGHEDGEETGWLEGASQSLWGHQRAQMLPARAGLHPFPGPGHHGDAKAGLSPTPAHESAHAQNGHLVHRRKDSPRLAFVFHRAGLGSGRERETSQPR
uniref:Uncharacterized protein n=1 Tax=Pipistrellus kuhlii TaxID=59472 RepID=A0A7J7U886_PIPKU|nr:hypothetical protein mPipKuh1_009183 [Pipistrellus kuhlii]